MSTTHDEFPDEAELETATGTTVIATTTGRPLSRDEAITIARAIDDQAPAPVGATEPTGPQSKPSRFFDPDPDPARTGIVIERCISADGDKRETFRLLHRIGYDDPTFGALLVPADPRTFRTDLGSIPMQFTWLVPITGIHLPAVLVHDGLVRNAKEKASGKFTHVGQPVPREDADRILREGMRDLGTSWLQRWIMWAATAIATLWAEPKRGSTTRWRVTIVLTLAVIAALGAMATVDVIDVWDALPWMGDDPWWRELAFGAAMALAVPVVLAAAAWARLWRAGMIAGIGLAFLLHVTLAVVFVSSIYMVADSAIERPWSAKRFALGCAGLVVGGVIPVLFAVFAVAQGD